MIQRIKDFLKKKRSVRDTRPKRLKQGPECVDKIHAVIRCNNNYNIIIIYCRQTHNKLGYFWLQKAFVYIKKKEFIHRMIQEKKLQFLILNFKIIILYKVLLCLCLRRSIPYTYCIYHLVNVFFMKINISYQAKWNIRNHLIVWF